MANWKRVLLSGSHFTVNELTISDIDSAASTDTILFAGSASSAGSGSFKTLSSLALDGTTTLDFTDGTFSGGFSGSGADLTGISATAEESLKAGAGLYILKETGGGEGQSGSPFSGNQASNLTAKLKGSSAGAGIYTDAGEDTNNTQAEVNSYNTNVNGGVVFMLAETVGDNVDIALATGSLAGDGLTFTTNFNILGLELDTSANADTTFDLGSSGLKIADAFAGDGLTLGSGILGIDLASDSGLTVTDALMTEGKLALASSVAGNGLTFGNTANDRSNLSIDASVVVTGSGDTLAGSNTIKINSEGPNIFIFQDTIRDAVNSGYGVIFVNGVGSAGNLDGTPYLKQTFTGTQPSYEFSLRKVWGVNDDTADHSDVTFENNVTMSGDLTVISSSNVINLQVDEFQTSDAFILINSGSGGGPTYPNKEGGIIVDRGPGSGSAVLYSSGSTQRIFAITNPNNASGVVQWNDTSVVPTGVPSAHVQSISLVYTGSTSDPINNDPAFADTEKFGSWYIEGDRNPAGNESNVWIYTDDFEDGGGGGA
jgi:hypothetical protein